MMTALRPLLLRYGSAVLGVAVATWIRLLLDPILGDEFPFATFFFAVMFSAWYGGLGPALAAVVLGALSASYFLLAPRSAFMVQGSDQQVELILYLLVSMGIALFGGGLRSAQLHAEEERKRLRVTLESIGDAVIVTDMMGRLTMVNPVAEALTGWKKADAEGKALERVFNIANEVTGQAVESPVGKVLREGNVVGLANHTVLIAKDGAQRPIEDSGAPIKDETGTIAGVVLVFRDVSERKRAEVALRDSEARFRTLVEQSVVGFYMIQGDRYTYVSPRLCEILGYSPDEMAARPVVDFIADEDRPLVADNIRKRLEGTVESVHYHVRMCHRDGGIVHLEAHGTRTEYAGKPCILGVALDVTEHRRAEEDRSRLAAIVDSSEDSIIGKTLDGFITSWNPGAERLYGYTAEETKGKDISMIVPSDRFGELPGIMERLQRGEAVPPVETRRVRKDGQQIEVSLTVSPIRDKEGRMIGASSIARDLSHTKELEGLLRQAQKMEAVGQLAGGVAHDFNNLLTIISGYSDLLLRSLSADDPDKGMLQEIYKAGERAAMLTRQLLAFSRKQVLEPKTLDLNAIIIESEKMLRRLIGEDVSVNTVLAPDLSAVKVDPGQVEQVIMNLAVNARDAMPQGGKLTIETANTYLDKNYSESHFDVKPGRYVMLAVSDTGHGMDQGTKAHIFEPFFTTKEPGKGTGLGLATIYGIVKQSEGNIYVYSEPGRGTTFKIYLPAVEEKVSSSLSIHGIKKALQGTETVLVVEDEPGVRSLSRAALRTHGPHLVDVAGGLASLILVLAVLLGLLVLVQAYWWISIIP